MKELDILARMLAKLPIDEQAKVSYDALAGGLVWSDEIPKWDFNGLGDGQFPVGHGEFRALLQHRSTLILNQPNQRFNSCGIRWVDYVLNGQDFFRRVVILR